VRDLFRSLVAGGFRVSASPLVYPVVERIADTRLPVPMRAVVHRAWGRALGVDMDEAAGSLEDYPTIASFFIRRLRPEARPVDPDPRTIVMPADGILEGSGQFDAGEDPVVDIKGTPLALGTLLGDFREVTARGGWYAVVYLAPPDYHRVHAPFGGRVVAWEAVGGTRYPVNRLGRAVSRDVLFRNERLVVEVETPELGRFYVVLVAAWGVARIGVVFAGSGEVRARSGCGKVICSRPYELVKGGELGWFNLGSTVVVIWPGGRVPVESARDSGPARVGGVLARIGTTSAG